MADNKIELRSEKVREIIDEKPSPIVRYGITLITLILLILLIIVYFVIRNTPYFISNVTMR
ncbi:hypothetical protein [Prevotella disiens]|uniref:Uncharacterized protein n=2 Tax=Prevotella disiens TaxID=28130 RepID=A0A379E061_9BACT|nr:hypothetical protein [Prevotella disiens]EFL46904.1 hypothetical protein HMPREF9296_2643 [Prevotella disiens FB035-09AN]RGL02826.1 hypothetical protein DXC89_03625 [Prevotella disiens]SUB85672.1 Uncharacterised protein [Prevotella disiens]